ncbi:DUF3316 domain-containing protein [Litoribrevibacter albus]|uniref:DUF1471 domain-containing protein n=1 Tax=Litoribrevibacter albus TaxID=1473156 RepID=A0AA37S8B8_9GAMM|nr:DUF3316 domain-containing protein [Litoribrevibacter albus]GLQ30263.1 hypothetical protein GCM10007876_07410 [Litoribrevibacter albus]
MKLFKTTVTALALSIVSLAATAEPLKNSANETVRNQSKVIEVLVSSSRQAAYQGALSKLDALTKSAPESLTSALHVGGGNDIDQNSLHLKEDNFVTVTERIGQDGNVQYVGLVHVNYHYIEDKSRN